MDEPVKNTLISIEHDENAITPLILEHFGKLIMDIAEQFMQKRPTLRSESSGKNKLCNEEQF
jgi:hypothetical protein